MVLWAKISLFISTATARRAQRMEILFAFFAVKNTSPRQLNLQLDSRLKRIEYAYKRVDCDVPRIALQS